jgi:hypothetical protein
MPSTTTRFRSNGSAKFYSDPEWGTSPLTGTAEWPSVTTILQASSKPALVDWAAREERDLCARVAVAWAQEIAHKPDAWRDLDELRLDAVFRAKLGQTKAYRFRQRRAMDTGMLAHAAIERQMRQALGLPVPDEDLPMSPEAIIVVTAWQTYATQHRIRPIASERTVHHPEWGYAGTIDLLAEADGEKVVLDFKASKGIYWEYELQAWAYLEALRALGESVSVARVVRLPKTLDEAERGPEIREVRLDDRDLRSAWRGLLVFWRGWWAQQREKSGPSSTSAARSGAAVTGPSSGTSAPPKPRRSSSGGSARRPSARTP